MNALTDLCLSFDALQLEKVLTRCLSFASEPNLLSIFPSHVSLGGCRVPWNQDKIEAVSSVHLHCYLGICALWHHLFLSFTIVSETSM